MKKRIPLPTFEAADDESLFLGSGNGLHPYKDLYAYQSFFLQLLVDFDADLRKPVGFLMPSCDELVFAIAACWNLGIPFCCFNPEATAKELTDQYNRIDPDVVFANKELMDKLPKEKILMQQQLDVKKALQIDLHPSRQVEEFEPDLDPEKVFGYFFTSGTTGDPKVVPLKRQQMIVAADSSAQNFRPRPNHFWLLCLPLNHIGGISIILRSLLYGSAIFRMKRFREEMVITFLTENKLIQAASLVPTMLRRLIQVPAFQTHNNFQAILLGGGPIDAPLVKQAIEKGIPLVPCYGMTETCAQISANPILQPSGIYPPLNSVGKIFEPNEIEIRDKNGEKLGGNSSGEIWLNGPQVFDGYLDVDKNNECFDADGWFNTGDYGHFNVHGQLFIEERRTDLIVTGGENVSPREVERALTGIPDISEAIVFGLSDEEWGQKVAALIVARNGISLDISAIKDALNEKLSGYKIPKIIEQTEELPKNPSGKIVRAKLPELLSAEKNIGQ